MVTPLGKLNENGMGRILDPFRGVWSRETTWEHGDATQNTHLYVHGKSHTSMGGGVASHREESTYQGKQDK